MLVLKTGPIKIESDILGPNHVRIHSHQKTLSSIPAVIFRRLVVNEPNESHNFGISQMIALSSLTVSFCGCLRLSFLLLPSTKSNAFAAWRYILLREYFGNIFNSSFTLTPLSWNKYLIQMDTASGICNCFFRFIVLG